MTKCLPCFVGQEAPIQSLLVESIFDDVGQEVPNTAFFVESIVMPIVAAISFALLRQNAGHNNLFFFLSFLIILFKNVIQ